MNARSIVRLVQVGIALSAALPLLPGAGRSPSAHDLQRAKTGAGSPIVIGVSNAQSGPSGFLGRSLVDGSRAYFNLVNRQGGVYGRPIDLVVEDDGYEPDPALRNTDDLIRNRRVLFLFDYVGTPTLIRALPLLRYHAGERFLNLGPFTGAQPQRRPPYEEFVFSIRASYKDEARALVDYLWAAGYRRIGLFEQADAYGKSGEIAFGEALDRHGLSLIARATYHRNSPVQDSMREQVDILRLARVDAIVAAGVYAPCAAFIRDLRLAGWNGPVANLSFVGADIMLDQLKRLSPETHRDLTVNLVNSEVVPDSGETQYPLVEQFRAAVPPAGFGFVQLEGWLNAAVATESLRRAGAFPTRAGLAKALESMADWDPGLGCKLGFSSRSHEGLHQVWLYRTSHGRWIPIHRSE